MTEAGKKAKHDKEKPFLRIGEAAASAGVSRQSLQYYLLVGLLDPAKRSKSGQQLFNQASIDRIKLIKKLNDSGYPLREIRDIFLNDKGSSL